MTKPNFRKYVSNDLFKSGDDWSLNACIGTNGGPYFYNDYSLGYFEAGRRLFESIKENKRLVDIVVYPFVYTYRHAIELGIKHLCIVQPRLLEADLNISYSHNLMDNWSTVKTLLEQLPNGLNDPKPIQFVDAVLRDIIQFDPRGEVFRFPMNKKEDLYLQDICHINLGIYGEIMQEINKCFSFWFVETEILYDFKSEIESEYMHLMTDFEKAK